MAELLRIENLHVAFPTDDGSVRAVDGVSLTLNEGETVAIVGESGSGKTVTGLSVMGLHKRGSAQLSGSIHLKDGDRSLDIVTASDDRCKDGTHCVLKENGALFNSLCAGCADVVLT